MATIDERLGRLERRVRFFQATTCILFLLVTTPIVLGATTQIPEVIQARAFEVVDASGRPVVQLESKDEGGRVWVWNKRGKVTLSLSNDENQDGVFRLYAHKGNRGLPYVVISADAAGGRITIESDGDAQRVIEPGP